ncbi:uncharacterized protein PAC_17444 [Phialocephala subalpina]|uniref:Uncharacterized protein n=1 Tax=Phialocephala subalpina TaxID=576137 RepID=A0A1L7XRB1_9HELO|nr:uncharacterized protein PAC_17444 [Phialocephala subalpina]
MLCSLLLASLAATPCLLSESSSASHNLSIFNTTRGYVQGAASEHRDGETTSVKTVCIRIWTPTYSTISDLSPVNLSVNVWIYSGLYEGGSADVLTYDGSRLASKDIVVVDMNLDLVPLASLLIPTFLQSLDTTALGIRAFSPVGSGKHCQFWRQCETSNSWWAIGRVGQCFGYDVEFSVQGADQWMFAENGARGPHDPITGSSTTSYRTEEAAGVAGVNKCHFSWGASECFR